MDPLEAPLVETPRDMSHDPEALLIIIQIALAGALIGFAGLGILLFWQDLQLHRQVENQAPVAANAEQDTKQVEALVRQFQALGVKYPDFGSKVLVHFNLPPATKGAAAPAAKPAK